MSPAPSPCRGSDHPPAGESPEPRGRSCRASRQPRRRSLPGNGGDGCRNRNHVVTMVEDPGQRHLSGGATVASRDLPDHVDQAQVVLEVVGLEAGRTRRKSSSARSPVELMVPVRRPDRAGCRGPAQRPAPDRWGRSRLRCHGRRATIPIGAPRSGERRRRVGWCGRRPRKGRGGVPCLRRRARPWRRRSPHRHVGVDAVQVVQIDWSMPSRRNDASHAWCT